MIDLTTKDTENHGKKTLIARINTKREIQIIHRTRLARDYVITKKDKKPYRLSKYATVSKAAGREDKRKSAEKNGEWL